jgi:hypothetical protein
VLASSSACKVFLRLMPPMAMPPMVKKSRREVPSQKPRREEFFRPKIVSMRKVLIEE